ncbi:MAG: hypothetical protein PHE83_16530 [Opitutaceae bacterium]|nr:hypothetical protein [Opitutaceae bacterium]
MAQQSHEPLSAAMSQAWFARFLAQQVIIAHALQEGFGERTEVRAEVERMERHMLTQPGGPFYERLYATEIPSLPAMDALYERVKCIYDVEILRLPKDTSVAAQIDNTFQRESSVEFEHLLQAAKGSRQAKFFDGSIAWPFESFEEIAATIEQASPCCWQRVTTADDLLFYYVRQVRSASLPPLDRIGPSLAQIARFTNERLVQRKRQSKVLHDAGFAFDWEAADQVVHRLLALKPDPLLPLSLDAMPDLQAMPVGWLSKDAAKQSVTVAEYVDYYNSLFVRRLPHKAVDIYEYVRSLIVARQDYDDARAMGIHLQAKFSEDRENYRNSLALELYEKERIRPRLDVTDDNVALFYREHSDTFTHPSRIEGIIVTFDQIGDAQTFARSVASRAPVQPPSNARSTKEVMLTKASEIPDMKYLSALVFFGATAPVLGPFSVGDAFSVWVYKKTHDFETQPLAAVARVIRTQLEQPLLEKYEADLAGELARRTMVEDHIDYSKYGISEMLLKPWST